MNKQILWKKYLKYLHKWADEHSNKNFYGMSPVCFDEWIDNEYYICSECGEPSESMYTISEWADELGYESEKLYLYELADKLNIVNSDICENCFNSILSSAGLI